MKPRRQRLLCSECGYRGNWPGDTRHHAGCERMGQPPDVLAEPYPPARPQTEAERDIWYGSDNSERDRRAERRQYGDRI